MALVYKQRNIGPIVFFIILSQRSIDCVGPYALGEWPQVVKIMVFIGKDKLYLSVGFPD